MTTSNNVIDINSFRKKKSEKADVKMTGAMERFIEAYNEAGPEATHMFNEAIRLFEAYGFEVEDFTHTDILLLRETFFSIILRYRQHYHPLHGFIKDFDKYFDTLEQYMDLWWVDVEETTDPDNDKPL